MFESKEKVLEMIYGRWGVLYRKHLIQADKERYYALLSAQELHDYITKVDLQAEHLFEDTVRALMKKKRITPELKESDPERWKSQMSVIEKQAEKSVCQAVIMVDKSEQKS